MEQPFPSALHFDIDLEPSDVRAQMERIGESHFPSTEELAAYIEEARTLFCAKAVVYRAEICPGESTGTIRANNVCLNLTPDGVKYCLYPCDGFFYATTLGPAISDLINSLRDSEPVRARTLANAAIYATGVLRGRVQALVEAEARRIGTRVGPIVQPGSLRCWDPSEQSKILEITNAGLHIGMRISESGWIDPPYSNTGFIPIGPRYKRDFAYSLCHQCPLTECAFRNEVKDIEDI